MSQADVEAGNSGSEKELKVALKERQGLLKDKKEKLKQAQAQAKRASTEVGSVRLRHESEPKEEGIGIGKFILLTFFWAPIFMYISSSLTIMAILAIAGGLSVDVTGWFHPAWTFREDGDYPAGSGLVMTASFAFYFYLYWVMPRRGLRKQGEKFAAEIAEAEAKAHSSKEVETLLSKELSEIQADIDEIKLRIAELKDQKLNADDEQRYKKASDRLKKMETLAAEKREALLAKSQSTYQKLKSTVEKEVDQLAQLSERHPSIGNFLMTRSIDDDDLDVFQRLDAIFDGAAKVESE